MEGEIRFFFFPLFLRRILAAWVLLPSSLEQVPA